MTDNDDVPDGEMSHMDFLRAQFFEAGSHPEKTPHEPTSRRQRPKRNPELAALARFGRAMEQMTQASRRAAIGWLADKYLGIKRLPQ